MSRGRRARAEGQRLLAAADDCVQAGALYRVMKEDARQRLPDNIAGSLAQVSRPGVIERSVEHFRKVDADFGKKLAEAIGRLMG